MARIRRSFTKEFKTKVLDEVDAGLTITQAARKFEVHPEMVRQWRAPRLPREKRWLRQVPF